MSQGVCPVLLIQHVNLLTIRCHAWSEVILLQRYFMVEMRGTHRGTYKYNLCNYLWLRQIVLKCQTKVYYTQCCHQYFLNASRVAKMINKSQLTYNFISMKSSYLQIKSKLLHTCCSYTPDGGLHCWMSSFCLLLWLRGRKMRNIKCSHVTLKGYHLW